MEDMERNETPSLPSPQPVLNAREAAKLLGIAPSSVYAATHRGELPHRRIGSRLVFSREALLRWLATGT